jgi:L-alanine-DL-glutamate epimerase-like enolase superfamily enzyme
LIVDAAMAWDTPTDAIAAINQWNDHDLAWIEDPFRADRIEWMKAVQRRCRIPLGGGDEVANHHAMADLITSRAVDVVRLDATCQGGITGLLKLIALASHYGVKISTHTYPEIHRHIALAVPGQSYIEVFAHESRFDSAQRFLSETSTARATDGLVDAPLGHGLDVQIDWANVIAADPKRES